MAKEKQLHLMTDTDVALIRNDCLPVWATAAATMHIDRLTMSELGLKKGKKDSPDETLKDKFPLFHLSLVNMLAERLVAGTSTEDHLQNSR